MRKLMIHVKMFHAEKILRQIDIDNLTTKDRIRNLARRKPTKFMAEDSRYDKGAADFVVAFIESLCHTKGIWAGKPFERIDWQEQFDEKGKNFW